MITAPNQCYLPGLIDHLPHSHRHRCYRFELLLLRHLDLFVPLLGYRHQLVLLALALQLWVQVDEERE